jgi:16S rRNA (cytosine1402-N4)-methyltransferase
MSVHVPVLLSEILENIELKQGDRVIDATLGAGGYSLAIREIIGEQGSLVSLDEDQLAISKFKKIIEEKGYSNIKVVQSNFRDIDALVLENSSYQLVVADLGLSSDQLADLNRGFSFNNLDSPLDMAFGQNPDTLTTDIVNNYSLTELIKIFKELGEEPHAYRVARAIVSFRRKERIARVAQLVKLIEETIGGYYKKKRIHPATLIFQALRMETNRELASLEKFLPQAFQVLGVNGYLVIVSFHSGEDRIVKHYFKNLNKEKKALLINKKPIIAKEEEIRVNRRARSAKLRIIKKLI